jgi:hypothetical protein
MREDAESGRWDTVNLRPDQLEQVLATDVVETIRIDQAMATVLARLEGTPPPPVRTVHYGAPIALCTMAIVTGSAALLLESDLWRASWRMAGIIGFTAISLMAAVAAVALLLTRLKRR